MVPWPCWVILWMIIHCLLAYISFNIKYCRFRHSLVASDHFTARKSLGDLGRFIAQLGHFLSSERRKTLFHMFVMRSTLCFCYNNAENMKWLRLMLEFLRCKNSTIFPNKSSCYSLILRLHQLHLWCRKALTHFLDGINTKVSLVGSFCDECSADQVLILIKSNKICLAVPRMLTVLKVSQFIQLLKLVSNNLSTQVIFIRLINSSQKRQWIYSSIYDTSNRIADYVSILRLFPQENLWKRRKQ